MAMKNVCRLCLTTDDLVWIFDKRFESSNNMKDVIYITTGVEITINDIISQNICKKCCQVTIKMFEFRRTSQKNDLHLREQCKVFLRDKELKIPNTQVTIRSEAKKSPGDNATPEDDAAEVKKDSKRRYKIHPSVRKLFKDYPQIKLPTVCLKYNIEPCVSMKMDQVEQYFTSRKLDFHKYTKLALRSGRVATKKTSAVHKSRNISNKPSISSKIFKAEGKNKTEVKEGVVAPLKIKLPPSDVVVDPNTNPSSTSTKNPENQILPCKRKFREVGKVEVKETKKTNFIESLGLTPKPETSTAPPSIVTNKSEPLYICEICNSVEYSHKDLKRHQNKHLRCQFCKMRFRNLENKEEHLSSLCPIKNMMNNLPDVKLQKVELNEWARTRYPEAFTVLEPTNNLEIMECDIESAVEPTDLKEPEAPSTACEIIEIISDDDDSLPSFSNDVQNRPLTDNATPGPSLVPKLETDAKRGGRMDIVYNTVSIVRPDIKIKGNCALDMIDARLTDIKVLKELLTHYKPVRLYDDKNVQTEMPVNDAILINRNDVSAELKLLKPQLHVYKVPVVIKNGTFNVCFKYTTWQKPQKRLCLWNDLHVIDVRPSNARPAPMIVLNESVANILPSTATYHFSGLPNKAQMTPVTSKFIRVNTSALSPITTASYTLPTGNSIVVNSQINNALQNATTTTQITNLEPPVVHSGPSVADDEPTVVISDSLNVDCEPVVNIELPGTSGLLVNSELPGTSGLPVNSELSVVNNELPVTSGPSVNGEPTVNSGPPVGGHFGTIRVKNVWELT